MGRLFLFGRGRHGQNAGRSASIAAARSPRFEQLEDRRLLTVSVETLHSFSSTANEWGYPAADLTLVGSTLFGETAQGGSDGDGTLFSMNLDGSNYQVVHTFTGSATDGATPYAGLTLVGSTLYGTTSAGGASNDGTVFSINTDGSDFQVLHSFGQDGNDGQNPYAGLTVDGSILYGTTLKVAMRTPVRSSRSIPTAATSRRSIRSEIPTTMAFLPKAI